MRSSFIDQSDIQGVAIIMHLCVAHCALVSEHHIAPFDLASFLHSI